jgi:cell division transport system ATP-binding protein
MIELKNVSKWYGKRQVLDNVSFSVGPGEFVCITGPSGAGKSTLVHVLAGAEDLSSGALEIDGIELHRIPPMAVRLFRRRVGIVFQDYKLLRHLTVRENIAFPLEVCNVPAGEIRQRVSSVISMLELEKQADVLPNELAGGEKARAAVGRAIINDPLILLADEPTGNLDPDQSMRILEIFRSINTKGTTVVLATHDSALVDSLQTRVLRLEHGTITRDSAGGYRGEKIKAPEVVAEAPVAETHTPKKKAAGKSTAKRKVKVTAVNGK